MKKETAPKISLGGLISPGSSATRIFLDPPEMETPRLLLRRLRLRDARDIYDWARDPEVARFVLWDAHRSIRDTREYIRYVKSLYRKGMPGSWGIELKATGQVIGTIGIMGWMPDHRCAEVGYSLGKAWWHQGYAPEALARLLTLMFDQMGVNRVEGQCDVRNENSGRVMEKCGMRKEGILRQRVWNKGESVDVILFAAIAGDRKS